MYERVSAGVCGQAGGPVLAAQASRSALEMTFLSILRSTARWRSRGPVALAGREPGC